MWRKLNTETAGDEEDNYISDLMTMAEGNRELRRRRASSGERVTSQSLFISALEQHIVHSTFRDVGGGPVKD